MDDESLVRRKGECMAEEGTLSIVRRGTSYQVRYASNNPYAQERPSHACQDEEILRAFLQQLGTDVTSICQACIDVRKTGVAVLSIVVSPAQIQAYFRPPI
jgi:hypothetical protein